MELDPEEEKLLRSVLLQNSRAVMLARERAERELVQTKEALERKTEELSQQRDWFQVTLSSIGDAVITTDLQGKVTFLNPMAETMTGWKSADALGQRLETVFQIVNEQSHLPVENPIVKVLQEGVAVELANHTALVAKDGTETAIEDSAAPIKDASGKISGAVMVFHDVTARRRGEAALRRSEELLSDFFENAAVGLHWVGPGGIILRANRTELQLLGYSQEEFVGRNIAEFHVDAPVIEDILRKLSCGDCLNSYEARLRCKNGSIKTVLISSNVLREDGKFIHTRCFTRDITEQKQAEEALQARERQLALIYDNVSDVIFYLAVEPGERFRFISVNQAFLTATSLSENQVLGKPVQEVFPEASWRLVLEHYHNAIRRRKTVRWEGTLEYTSGKKVGIVSITPIFDGQGQCVNLIGTVHEISQEKQAEEVRLWLAAIVESSDDAIISKTLDGTITSWNKGAEHMYGYVANEVIGKSVTILIPPNLPNEEPSIVARLKRGEKIEHYETVRVRKDGTFLNVALTVSPIKDATGKIIGASKIARDITERKKAADALSASEQQLRATFNQAAVGMATTGLDGRFQEVNQRICDILGYSPEELQQRTFLELTHPDDQEPTARRVRQLVAGEIAEYSIEKKYIRKDGLIVWALATVTLLKDADGKPNRFIGAVEDITERKKAESSLQDETRVLNLLNRTGTEIASKLDLESLVQTVTDAGRELSGAKFGAFFHNVRNEQGESLLLYTLSGASREAFEKFGHPRATPVFAPTFRGEGVVRSADIMKDPRYGQMAPHFGMPKGHLPVRSYLAVSVVSRSGEVIGGLFFAHPEPDIFTERSERLIVGIAAQAAIAIDNARLYEAAQKEIVQRKQVEKELQQSKDELEQRVQQRTASLKETTAQLEAFCYTIAHDLRSPLRTQQSFAQVLLEDHRKDLDETGRDYAQRIINSAQRMDKLVEDLLVYSRLSRSELKFNEVNLSRVVEDIQAHLADEIRNRKATITVASLLPVSAYEPTLNLVLTNLVMNALKFVKPGVAPRIRIWSEPKDRLVKLWVEDNGIGISREHIGKVFGVFERLHSADQYPGTGIGLAIVQKGVERMGGTVGVESKVGEGSRFWIELPAADNSIHPQAD